MADPTPRRIAALDLARSAALAGMVAFHFSYDLLMFGFLPPSYAASGFFYYHARIVAGSFIFLAGLGLWLAHQDHLDWAKFLRRLARIVAAAALVSLATRLAMPDSYVFFGILHAISLFSLLGLAFLRLPTLVTILVAGLVFFGGDFLRTGAFDHPLIQFLGLSTLPAYTIDFEPFFPWFCTFLLGLAAGRIGTQIGLWQRLALWPKQPMRLVTLLARPGQHSLLIYLVHQPILLSLVWALSLFRQ